MFPDTITTPRLDLLRWQPAFAEGYAAMCADPEVMTYIAEGLPYSAERALRSQQKISDHWEAYGYGMYAVFLHGQPDLIGMCGLATADYLAHTAPVPEIGRRFVQAHWGKALAREAATHVVETIRTNHLLPELVAVIQPANERSKLLARALGMQKTAEDIDADVQKPVEIWHLRC